MANRENCRDASLDLAATETFTTGRRLELGGLIDQPIDERNDRLPAVVLLGRFGFDPDPVSHFADTESAAWLVGHG